MGSAPRTAGGERTLGGRIRKTPRAQQVAEHERKKPVHRRAPLLGIDGPKRLRSTAALALSRDLSLKQLRPTGSSRSRRSFR